MPLSLLAQIDKIFCLMVMNINFYLPSHCHITLSTVAF